MADEINLKTKQTPNQYKEVHIYFNGGNNWWIQLGGPDKTWQKYFPEVNGTCGLHLYLDKGVSLRVDSEFAPVLEDLMNKFKTTTVGKAVGLVQKAIDVMNAIGTVTKPTTKGEASGLIGKATSNLKVLPPNVRYETKFQKLPAWKSTSALNIGDFKFRFYMGQAGVWDARQEVYNPALAFMKVNQPSEPTPGRLQGPMPSTSWVYGVLGASLAKSVGSAISSAAQKAQGNVEAGNSFATAAAEHADSTIAATLEATAADLEKRLSDRLNNWPGNGLITVKIGQFTFPRMYVPKTSVEFSPETDENGYPIWADVTWSGCQTVEVATTEQMPLKSVDGTLFPTTTTTDSLAAASIDNVTMPVWNSATGTYDFKAPGDVK